MGGRAQKKKGAAVTSSSGGADIPSEGAYRALRIPAGSLDALTGLVGETSPANVSQLRARSELIPLPDGRVTSWSELIKLTDRGDHTDPERKYLITRRGSDEPAQNSWWHVHSLGIPRVIEASCPEQCEPGSASDNARVTLEWSTRLQFGRSRPTLKDVNSGDYLALHGSPPISTKTEIARYANIIKGQLEHPKIGIKVKRAPVRSGWSHDLEGRPRFVPENLCDCYRLGDDGQAVFDGSHEPMVPSTDDLAYLVNAWMGWAPDGSGVATLAFAVRGLFATLKRLVTALVLTGATGASKTTPARFALGLLRAVLADASLTLTFTASAAAMKAKIAWRHDLTTVHDDFHKMASEGSHARAVDAFDSVLRAIASGDGLNDRGTKTGGLRDPVYLRGAHIFTGEELDGLITSAERRMAWIGYSQDINSDEIYAEWDALQRIWEGTGHAVVRWAFPIFASPGGPDKLADIIQSLDRQMIEALFNKLTQLRPEAPHKFVRSMSLNWGPLLTGAYLADVAVGTAPGDGPMLETLRQHITGLALRQLDRLSHGSPPERTAKWYRELIKDALETSQVYVTAQKTAERFDKAIHPGKPPAKLFRLGYRPLPDGREAPAGFHVGYLANDEKMLLLETDALLRLVKQQARRDGIAYALDPDKLVSEVVRLEVAIPGKKTGTQVRKINGVNTRVLAIPYLDDEDIPDEELDDENTLYRGKTGVAHVADVAEPIFSSQAIDIEYFPLAASRYTCLSPGVAAVAAMTAPLGENSKVSADFEAATLRYTHLSPGVAAAEIEQTRVSADFDAVSRTATPATSATPQKHPYRQARIAPTAGEPIETRSFPPKQERGARPRVEHATEPKGDLPSDDGAGENHASAGPPGEAEAVRAGAAVKRPPGILVLEAEATWLGTDAVAGIEAIAPVLREKRRKRPMPIEAVLDRARELGDEQVVLERTWTAATPLPQTFQRGDAASPYLPSGGIAHSWATPAADSPWTLTNPGRLLTSIWARHKGGGSSIEILIPQYVKGPWADAPDGETLAHGLVAYRNSTADNGRAGFGYRNSSGNTFIRMWRALTRDRGVADVATDLVPSAYPEPAHAVPEAVADLAYSRLPVGAEVNASSCVVIDGSSQYLRVLDINCGAGSIEHLSGAAAAGEFLFKRPGWWRVRYRVPPAWPDTLPAPGWPLAANAEGWLVSETLAFLAEIGAEIEIFEAYLWSRSTRALARLQNRLRNGRLYLIERSQDVLLTPAERAGAGLALKAAKDTYKAGVGWFSRVSNRDKTELIDYHRPHWRHAIIARSTVAVLRDIFGAYQRTGLTPIAIAVDGLGYMTDLPADQLAAHLGLPIGLGLGQYKHSHVVPGAAMLPALAATDGTALSLITGNKEVGDGTDA